MCVAGLGDGCNKKGAKRPPRTAVWMDWPHSQRREKIQTYLRQKWPGMPLASRVPQTAWVPWCSWPHVDQFRVTSDDSLNLKLGYSRHTLPAQNKATPGRVLGHSGGKRPCVRVRVYMCTKANMCAEHQPVWLNASSELRALVEDVEALAGFN